MRIGRRVLGGGALALVILLLLFLFLVPLSPIQAFTVSSTSMAPTLLAKDSVLVNALVYRFRAPRRGDIILFRFPRVPGQQFVKRVIAVPGDVVEEQEGHIYVNGKRVAQPVAANGLPGPEGAMTLAPQHLLPGQLFVLGDNPSASLDSRYWGDVDIRDVVGTAFLVGWSRGPHWWDVRWNRLGRWLSSRRPAA